MHHCACSTRVTRLPPAIGDVARCPPTSRWQTIVECMLFEQRCCLQLEMSHGVLPPASGPRCIPNVWQHSMGRYATHLWWRRQTRSCCEVRTLHAGVNAMRPRDAVALVEARRHCVVSTFFATKCRDLRLRPGTTDTGIAEPIPGASRSLEDQARPTQQAHAEASRSPATSGHDRHKGIAEPTLGTSRSLEEPGTTETASPRR